LNSVITAALGRKRKSEHLSTLGVEPIVELPEYLVDFPQQDIDRWKRVIVTAEIKF